MAQISAPLQFPQSSLDSKMDFGVFGSKRLQSCKAGEASPGGCRWDASLTKASGPVVYTLTDEEEQDGIRTNSSQHG